jgi:phosphoribosylformimino-5-aminoimidazole carboxamide ribonucleotide (ProFAR) isomerase
MHRVFGYAVNRFAVSRFQIDRANDFNLLLQGRGWHSECSTGPDTMTEREAKSRAVKILAKSIYRDLEAQGFDEKQIVALATELISEVTSKMSRTDKAQQLA